MNITYLGHAGLSIAIAGKHLIVDPFISGNPLAKSINLAGFKADYILVTHAHQDHILDVETIAKRTGATVISNFEVVTHFENLGIKGHPMNHGGSWQFDFGTLTYTNAIHSSSFPDGSYGGQPGGFIIETSEGNIYVAGDTALTYDMKLVPLKCKLNLAVLPVGDNFTMGYKSACIAADFVECNRVLGYHYDTFGYIEINHQDAIEYFKAHQKELHLLKIGESINV